MLNHHPKCTEARGATERTLCSSSPSCHLQRCENGMRHVGSRHAGHDDRSRVQATKFRGVASCMDMTQRAGTSPASSDTEVLHGHETSGTSGLSYAPPSWYFSQFPCCTPSTCVSANRLCASRSIHEAHGLVHDGSKGLGLTMLAASNWRKLCHLHPKVVGLVNGRR